MPWFGQAADAAGGQMQLEYGLFDRENPKLDLDYDVSSSKAVVQALVDRHESLSRATGGVAIEPIAWRAFDYLITPHPLGGCNMADRIEDGVVDHVGEVFNYPRLYVMDGATVPRALGLNPSRTIAALAERNVALMLAD
jgi:cholesterol oxidase